MTSPLVVFVPGAGENRRMLASTALLCTKAGFDTLVINLPKHKTGENPEGLTLGDYKKEVSRIITKMASKRGTGIVLVGHSMGGLIAQMVATENAHVIGLILIASAPPRGISLPLSILGKMLLRLDFHYVRSFLTFGKLTFLREHLKELFLNKAPNADLRAGEFGPESATAVLQIALNGFWIGASIDPKKIKVPVLAIGGQNDRVITPRVQAQVAKRYGVKPVIIPNAGHCFFFEPSFLPFIREMIGWLKIHFPERDRVPTKVLEAAE